MNKQIVIGGFHRSGTSFLARILHESGINMGETMLGSRASNIHGHYEDTKVIKIHNTILAHNRLTWMEDKMQPYQIHRKHISLTSNFIQNRNARHENWGFKDPRFCLFTMLWKMLMPHMKVVIVYRHYTSCYESLNKRHIKELFHSNSNSEKQRHLRLWNSDDLILKMWLVHNNHLLNFAKNFPDDVILISHEEMMSKTNLIKNIQNKWDIQLNDLNMDNYIDSSLVKSRRKTTIPCSNKEIANQVKDTFKKLEQFKELASS